MISTLWYKNTSNHCSLTYVRTHLRVKSSYILLVVNYCENAIDVRSIEGGAGIYFNAFQVSRNNYHNGR